MEQINDLLHDKSNHLFIITLDGSFIPLTDLGQTSDFM